MKAIAIILALLYIVIGVALAFALVRAFAHDCGPEEAEAAASLVLLAAFFWPLALLVLGVLGVFDAVAKHITEHRNEDQP